MRICGWPIASASSSCCARSWPACTTHSRRRARSAATSRRSAPRTHAPTSTAVRTRTVETIAERGVGRRRDLRDGASATSSSTARRCARRWRSPDCCRPPTRQRCSADLRARPRVSGWRCRAGRSRWAPVPRASPTTTSARATAVDTARVSDRRTAGEQRRLAGIRRAGRLCAPRAVVRRRLGMAFRAGRAHSTRRSPPAIPTPRLPHQLLRGRGIRARARRAPAQRGGVGEGGDIRAAGRRRTRVGVDEDGFPRLPRVSSPTPTASTRRCSSARTTAC